MPGTGDSYEFATLEASGVADVAYSPDQTLLYAAMRNGDINVYDVVTRQKVGTWHVGTALGGISVSTDGSFLLVVERGLAHTAAFYRVDTATGAAAMVTAPAVETYRDVEIVDSDTAIFSGAEGSWPPPTLYNLQTGLFSPDPNFTPGSNAVFVEDEHYTLITYSGDSSGPMALFDDRTNSIVATGSSRGPNFGQQAISEAAGRLVFFGYAGEINVFDLNLQFIKTVSVGERLDGLVFDPSGKYVYVYLIESGLLAKYDLATWTRVDQFDVGTSPWHNYPNFGSQLLINDDGTRITIVDSNAEVGKLRIVDTTIRNERFEGTAGADAFAGGKGDDTYVVNHAGDTIAELAHEGEDTVETDLGAYTLGSNLERLTGTSATGQGLYGNAAGNRITGGAGNDYIDGGNGTDIMHGGDGDDALGDTSDSAINEIQNDELYGEAGDDHLYLYRTRMDASTNRLDGGAGNDHVSFEGWYFTQTLTLIGGDGDDVISLVGGRDVTIDAGAGDDLVSFNFSEGMDRIALTLGAGTDLVEVRRDRFTNNSLTTAIHITDFDAAAGDRVIYGSFLRLLTNWDYLSNPFATGHLKLEQRDGVGAVLRLDLDGGGNGFQDFIVFEGVAADSLGLYAIGFAADGSDGPGITLDGTAAGDTLVGTGHDDVIHGLDGSDRLFGDAGDDLIEGGLGDDTLSGGWGNDQMYGGDGADQLDDVESGNDSLYGGDGNDRLAIARNAAAPDAVLLLDGGAGDDGLGYGPLNETPYRFLHDDVTLIGGDGKDVINVSSPKTAIIDAGAGDDYVSIANSGTVFTISLGSGVDTLNFSTTRASVGTILVTDYETGAAGDKLEIDTYLRAVLTGWDPTTSPFETGFLQLVQRGPDSALLIDRDGPTGAGAWADLAVFSNTVAASFTGRNLGGYSSIAGTDGDDHLEGDEGIDFIRGFGGNDTLIGSGKGDTLEGGTGNDVLDGGQGNDKLDGGSGADSMTGGDGNDLYLVDDVGDQVVEAVTPPWTSQLQYTYVYDEVRTALASYTLPAGVEWLIGTSDSGQILTGNNGANLIRGGGGDDFIYLLEGLSQASGGAGDDRIEGGGDVDILNGGAGSDILLGLGGDDFLQGGLSYVPGGDTGNDRLEGGDGDDRLDGNRGNDILLGGAGDDVVSDDQGGNDLLDGGDGDDQLFASNGFASTSGARTLIGGLGNDRALVSAQMGALVDVDLGAGDDSLLFTTNFYGIANVTLGAGHDTLEFSGYSPSFQPGSSVTVTDFTAGVGGDVLLLKDSAAAATTCSSSRTAATTGAGRRRQRRALFRSRPSPAPTSPTAAPTATCSSFRAITR
jgi:Ca2+-binding RTX toxin-like protein